MDWAGGQSGNEHDYEFTEDIGGIATWTCRNCGETLVQYQDITGR